MAPALDILMVFLRFANLLLAAYLLYVVYAFYRAKKDSSFSRTSKLMMVAVLLFFATEFVQVFNLIPSGTFATLQSVFAFVFLIMLVQAMLEIRKGVLAHDHLVRRRHKQRLSYVE